MTKRTRVIVLVAIASVAIVIAALVGIHYYLESENICSSGSIGCSGAPNY